MTTMTKPAGCALQLIGVVLFPITFTEYWWIGLIGIAMFVWGAKGIRQRIRGDKA